MKLELEIVEEWVQEIHLGPGKRTKKMPWNTEPFLRKLPYPKRPFWFGLFLISSPSLSNDCWLSGSLWPPTAGWCSGHCRSIACILHGSLRSILFSHASKTNWILSISPPQKKQHIRAVWEHSRKSHGSLPPYFFWVILNDLVEFITYLSQPGCNAINFPWKNGARAFSC